MSASTKLSTQESLYPELTCFGYGQANPSGFHLRSRREGELTVAELKPDPEHGRGFGFVNGGIIATLQDCHSAAAVMWEAVKRRWHDPTGAPPPCVTASFDAPFHLPTPLSSTVRLTAWPDDIDPSQIIIRSEMTADHKVTAA